VEPSARRRRVASRVAGGVWETSPEPLDQLIHWLTLVSRQTLLCVWETGTSRMSGGIESLVTDWKPDRNVSHARLESALSHSAIGPNARGVWQVDWRLIKGLGHGLGEEELVLIGRWLKVRPHATPPRMRAEPGGCCTCKRRLKWTSPGSTGPHGSSGPLGPRSRRLAHTQSS
jgi:hypothetical protein